ncbi:hypothetical protein F5Y01DRAFT_309386 [Xylaria sp. FL0043]|nr:hypothetical protein F5Y01DRAFT_309386 [Xylaria sp. FL0043]
MLYLSLLLLPAFGLLAQATEGYSPLSMPSRRRQLMTCDQTYGNGSTPCGEPERQLCYNPGLGQTCCKLDGGFCNEGSYCAPVAGYCCLEDEDLTECAERAGFELPNAAVNDYSATSGSAVVAPARVSRTFTVTPFLTPYPGPTPIIYRDRGISDGLPRYAFVFSAFSARNSTGSKRNYLTFKLAFHVYCIFSAYFRISFAYRPGFYRCQSE